MSDYLRRPFIETFPTRAAFDAFAGVFALSLRPGDVVGLSGELGAGKTAFVRAAVYALQGSEEVTSPTFAFRHRYGGEPPVEHIDLYRVEDTRELAELGLEDAFDGTNIVFVEWWQRGREVMPPTFIDVTIEGAGDEPRTVRIA